MSEQADTLRGILLPVHVDLSETEKTSLETTEKIRELKDKLEEEAKSLTWPDTFNLITKKIGELLNVPILDDILIKVWNEGKLFRQPGETIEVPLVKHTIKSTHRPYIEVRLNETLLDRVDFEIVVKLTVEGVVLEIQDGKIKKFRCGECTGEASLKCEGFLLASEKSKPIKLPGVKEFKPGIAIAA
jgi:hypothetical protein